MRKLPLLSVLLALIVSPAFANDIKEQAPKMRADFIDAYNRQDVAALAAAFTADAVVVNPMGVHPVNAQMIEGWFKDGPRKVDTTFDQALPLGADTALGIGTFQITGKTLKGEPVDFKARWAATYVRDGGQWKVRLQSAVPMPPPAK
jgi:ketosteroid isomerase-like protein